MDIHVDPDTVLIQSLDLHKIEKKSKIIFERKNRPLFPGAEGWAGPEIQRWWEKKTVVSAAFIKVCVFFC